MKNNDDKLKQASFVAEAAPEFAERTSDLSPKFVVKEDASSSSSSSSSSEKNTALAVLDSAEPVLAKAPDLISYFMTRMTTAALDNLVIFGIFVALYLVLLMPSYFFPSFAMSKSLHECILTGILLAMPFVDAWLYLKQDKPDGFATMPKTQSKFCVVGSDGKPITWSHILLRSYAKYIVIWLSLVATQKTMLPIIILPCLLIDRRFIHDWISGTRVITKGEDPATTFYPRASIWTKVLFCWFALCLAMVPARWTELQSHASIGVSKLLALVPSPSLLKFIEKEVLFKQETGTIYEDQMRLRLLLLTQAIEMHRNSSPPKLDDYYKYELHQRAYLARTLDDPQTIPFFLEYLEVSPDESTTYASDDPYFVVTDDLISKGKYVEALALLEKHKVRMSRRFYSEWEQRFNTTKSRISGGH